MKKGFSVLELVISLMVIASIMAAFTPLITKKFSSSIFGKGGKVNLTTDCTDKFNEYCTLCDDKRCIRCTLDPNTCADDQYKDTASCSCKDCKETYGEDCEKCNEKKCLTCPDGEYLDSDDNCQSCSDKFTNCATCTESECTSCADGYVLTDPTSNTPCSEFNCSGPDLIQVENLCITKKNMGDGTSLTIPGGVNIVKAGTTCNSSETNYCCWKEATATPCDNENGGAYSGCDRTVCDWWAADYICKNFTAEGRTWRLPTTNEMTKWGIYSIGKGVNGLQLCDSNIAYLSAYCSAGISRCSSLFPYSCSTERIWSGVERNDGYNAYAYILFQGDWYSTSERYGSSLSVRCVTKMPQSCAQKAGINCKTCNGSTCLDFDSAYCKSKFGSNCTACNENTCTICASGYKISNGSCVVGCDFTKAQGTFCTGSDFMPLCTADNKLICVTRKNMGDSSSLPIPNGVSVKMANQNCTSSSSNKCCWRGNTSSDCDNTNGGAYSGCNRTVCDWWAADYICKNFNAGGKTWRLPTIYEMSNWAVNSKGLATNGLQLCDSASGYSSAYCYDSNSCPGTRDGSCDTECLWSGSIFESSIASVSSNPYRTRLYYGDWEQYRNVTNVASSVRCVTEL